MSYEQLLDSAEFNIRNANLVHDVSDAAEYREGEIGIVSSIIIPRSKQRTPAPEFNISIGQATFYHDDLRDDAAAFLEPPVEALSTVDGLQRYRSGGFKQSETLSVSGGFEDHPSSEQYDSHLANAALAIGIKSTWAVLALISSHESGNNPSNREIKTAIRLLDSSSGRKYGSILDDEAYRGGITILSGDGQVDRLRDDVSNN